ncbi:MAG: TIGR01906 family membrane protein [Candidatus Limnocylindrales bacterium]
MRLSPLERLAAIAAAVTAPIVIVAVAVLLFLNPIWVGFDQDRTNAAELTGYTPSQVHQVTGSILSDLVFGPASFDVTVDGQAVLDQRARSHMADVRTVFAGLGLVALVAALVLVSIGVAYRGRRWFWQAAALGASVLAGGVIVVGIAFVLFFDQAFELFHEIFFPPGTYSFDPKTEKLVQLFPDQFWSETSVALAVVVLALALGARSGARRLADTGVAAGAPSALGEPSVREAGR